MFAHPWSTLISGGCSCIMCLFINNLWWFNTEANISGFLKTTKWSGGEYECLTSLAVWWLDFKGLCSSKWNFKLLWVLSNIGFTTWTFKFIYHIAAFQMCLLVLVLQMISDCLCFMNERQLSKFFQICSNKLIIDYDQVHAQLSFWQIQRCLLLWLGTGASHLKILTTMMCIDRLNCQSSRELVSIEYCPH